MNISWNIIFAIQKGTRANAQAVYNVLMKTALTYRYSKTGLAIIPVSPVEITDSIFRISDHDHLNIKFEGSVKNITGKDLKELFIASIFLKHLEEKGEYVDGSGFFVSQPDVVGSCDVNIFVSKPELVKINDVALKLSSDYHQYPLQIKEYFDYAKSNKKIMIPEPIDVSRLEGLAGNYKEITLIFLRELLEFNTVKLGEFFKRHPNCSLISVPQGSEISYTPKDNPTGSKKVIPLPSSKHNYLLTFSDTVFSVVSFDKPPFLVEMGPFSK